MERIIKGPKSETTAGAGVATVGIAEDAAPKFDN